MSNERPSSSKQLVVGLVIGVLALAGAILALRPVGTTPPAQVEIPKDKPAPPPAASAPPNDRQMHPLSQWQGPFAFDPLGYLPEATRLAQQKYADAVLTSVRLSKVKPVGRLNLKEKESFATYRFRSPSRSATGGAEPCLLDVVVTAEGVQLSTPETAAGDCASPAVAVPGCDLLRLWLLALQEATPTEPLGLWELSAAPGAQAGAPAGPGHWKLTMPASPEPFVRSFDAACSPIGRTKPVAAVNADRFRAEMAGAPKLQGPDAPTTLVKPISIRGGLTLAAIQDVMDSDPAGLADCFTRATSACERCLQSASATVSFTVDVKGAVGSLRASATPLQEIDAKVSQATDQFRGCVEQRIQALAFPAAPEPTVTRFKVSVTAREPRP